MDWEGLCYLRYLKISSFFTFRCSVNLLTVAVNKLYVFCEHQVIQLEEVLNTRDPSAASQVRINYTDLDLSCPSQNPSPNVSRAAQTHPEPATDYAVIDFEATSAVAAVSRDHVRLREKLEQRRDGGGLGAAASLSRAASSVATGNTQQL